MNRQAKIAGLLRSANHATTLSEQTEFVRQAELLKNEDAEEARASGWDAKTAVINDALVPAPVHELHTAATDWLTEVDTSFDPKAANNTMVAEAALWYGRVSDEIKSYGDEYAEQARNLARRLAGQFGEGADVAERAFVDEAARLRTQAVKNGLVKEAGQDPIDDGSMDASQSGTYELNDDGNLQASSSLQRMAVRETDFVDRLFESLATVEQSTYPQNSSLPPGATDSNRGPVMQELLVPNPSEDVVPVNDPGLENQPQPFPVSGSRKESNMHVACPTCHGQGKVAVRKEAASGLPQIDQIVDPHDNPSQTPYPGDVAFPWTLNPSAQVAQMVQQGEAQIAERNQRSPLAGGQTAQASQHTAGGRDNSGWAGDMGAKGIDYPGWQIGEYPQGPAGGYVDPVYGQGGDQPGQPELPYGHQEAADYTNNPQQNWQPGQPTQADQAWKTVTPVPGPLQPNVPVAGPGGSVQAAWNRAVNEDQNLAAALEYVEAARRRVGR